MRAVHSKAIVFSRGVPGITVARISYNSIVSKKLLSPSKSTQKVLVQTSLVPKFSLSPKKETKNEEEKILLPRS